VMPVWGAKNHTISDYRVLAHFLRFRVTPFDNLRTFMPQATAVALLF